MSPPENTDDTHILKEEEKPIYTHSENVLVDMIYEQDAQIFKSRNDYVKNKQKFSEYMHYAE